MAKKKTDTVVEILTAARDTPPVVKAATKALKANPQENTLGQQQLGQQSGRRFIPF